MEVQLIFSSTLVLPNGANYFVLSPNNHAPLSNPPLVNNNASISTLGKQYSTNTNVNHWTKQISGWAC